MNRLDRIALKLLEKRPAYEVLGAIMIEQSDAEHGHRWTTRADIGKLNDSKPIRVKMTFDTLDDAQAFGEKLLHDYPPQDEMCNTPTFIIDDI